MLITSASNPRVKELIKLRDRRARDKSGTFLIEGYREISRAQHEQILFLFFSPFHFLGNNEEKLIEALRCRGAELFALAPELFEKVSYRDRPDGLLAVAKQNFKTLTDLPHTQNPFFLIAEAIEKPGNLGTMLRSSDSVGCDGVIVADPKTDIYNPNVVRASVGTLFTQPVVQTHLEEALDYCEKQGIQIVATTPKAELLYTEADLRGPVAIAAGTEQLGLSKELMRAAKIAVRIPMRGVADSLNVASATTLVLYEVLRQRSIKR